MIYLKKDVLRLAATYLVIIMSMSIVFSTILYAISANELGRRPNGLGPDVRPGASSLQQFFEQREQESRQMLIVNLLFANVVMLGVGALISYVLAERSLRPIEENMTAQAQFVSDASHELRTPLTALRTANEVALRSRTLKLSDAKQVIKENVDDIARLQGLTDSMLGLLKDEAPAAITAVDLQAVVNDAISMVAPLALTKQLTISNESQQAMARGDHQRFVQLVTILLDNAVKYSAPGTRITITTKELSRRVHLIVQDQGVGMDHTTLQQVFTRFYRADHSRSTVGYGLGLAIAQKIAHAYHATITVASKPGAGSTFTVSLPKA